MLAIGLSSGANAQWLLGRRVVLGILIKGCVFAVVGHDIDRLGLGPVPRVEADQVPFVDPGPDVLPHPGGAEPFQPGDVRRLPAERVAVQLLEAGVARSSSAASGGVSSVISRSMMRMPSSALAGELGRLGGLLGAQLAPAPAPGRSCR